MHKPDYSYYKCRNLATQNEVFMHIGRTHKAKDKFDVLVYYFVSLCIDA